MTSGCRVDNKQKHLEFIQAAITRMAGNLFLLKGWSITLIAGLFALSAKDSNIRYMLLAYYPLFVFWGLDGYFLAQERRFRSLYDYVRKLPEAEIDFSMDTSPFARDFRNKWRGAVFSKTLATYYGLLAAIMIVLMFALPK